MSPYFPLGTYVLYKGWGPRRRKLTLSDLL